MRHLTRTLAPVATALALAVLPALGAGGSKIEEPSAPEPKSPEQQANERYNEGLAERDAAWRLEKKLVDPDTPAAKRTQLEKSVREAYANAARDFNAAIALHPGHFQALADLGYVARQLGDYAGALEAYGAALELKPGYARAIEYRAEAYLGLNRVVDAQNAYRELQEREPKLAAELLGAMESWITARRADPAGVDPAQVEGLALWIADRGAAAAGSSLHKTRSW
jgi:tetratricopeptide (TPR) repeat protein